MIVSVSADVAGHGGHDSLATFKATPAEQRAFRDSAAYDAVKSKIFVFRLWCVVELAAAVSFGKPVVIKWGRARDADDATATGGAANNKVYDTRGGRNVLMNLTYMVDVEASECYKAEDKARELDIIRKEPGGMARVQAMVEGVLKGAHHR